MSRVKIDSKHKQSELHIKTGILQTRDHLLVRERERSSFANRSIQTMADWDDERSSRDIANGESDLEGTLLPSSNPSAMPVAEAFVTPSFIEPATVSSLQEPDSSLRITLQCHAWVLVVAGVILLQFFLAWRNARTRDAEQVGEWFDSTRFSWRLRRDSRQLQLTKRDAGSASQIAAVNLQSGRQDCQQIQPPQLLLSAWLVHQQQAIDKERQDKYNEASESSIPATVMVVSATKAHH